MANEEAPTLALDLLYGQMSFYVDAINSVRTSLAAILGFGTTVDLAIVGVIYHESSNPGPNWALWVAIATLAVSLVIGAGTLSQLRRAAKWPDILKIVVSQRGSARDLRERVVEDFQAAVAKTRFRLAVVDLVTAGTLVTLILSGASWAYVLTQSGPAKT